MCPSELRFLASWFMHDVSETQRLICDFNGILSLAPRAKLASGKLHNTAGRQTKTASFLSCGLLLALTVVFSMECVQDFPTLTWKNRFCTPLPAVLESAPFPAVRKGAPPCPSVTHRPPKRDLSVAVVTCASDSEYCPLDSSVRVRDSRP